MTNEPLDTQPVVGPFHVLVRGDRLTRFKGQMAGIAPSLSVVASATVQRSAESRRACVEKGC